MANEGMMNSSIAIDTTNAKANITDLNRQIRVLESGFKAAASGMDDWSATSEGNEARLKSLNDIMGLQKTKIANLTDEYEKVKAEKGENSKAAQDLEIKINKEKEALGKNEVAARECSERLTTLASESDTTGTSVDALGKESEKTAKKHNVLQDAAGKLSDALKSGLKVAAEAAVAAIAAVGTAAAAAAGEAFNMAKGAGEMADNLMTLSAQTGVSSENLQGWGYAARFIDTDVSTMTGSMAKMVKQMGEAAGGSEDSAEKFKTLGVSIKDSNGNLRDSEDVFADAIDALGKIPNEAERDAAAMDLFGKSAQDLNPLIKAGGEELSRLSEQAKQMGVVFDGDALAAMGSFDDSIQRAKAAGEGLSNSIGLTVIPAFQPMVDAATNAMASVSVALQDGLQPGEVEELVQGLMDELSTMITDLTGIVEQAIPVATAALNTIITTLAEALPGLIDTLLPAAMGLLQSLLDAITTNIEPLTALAVSLVTQLGTFLMENAPELLTAAIGIISGLVDGLTESLPELIPIAIEMMVKLAVALVEAIPELVAKLPEIVAAIWAGLVAVDWAGLGLELIQGLVSGLTGAVSSLLDTIKGVFSGIWDAILGVFGIASPSTEAASAGQYILDGLLEGLKAGVEKAVTIVKEIFGKIWDAIKSIFGFGGESNEAQQANDAGQSLMEGVTDGIRGGEDDLKTSLDGIVTTVLSNFRSALGVTEEGTSTKTNFAGGAVVKGLIDGMSGAATAEKFSGAANAIGNAASTALRSALGVGGEGWFGSGTEVAGKFKDVGKAIAEGIARGIESGADAIKSAAKKAANDALDAAKKELGIASPSKVARDQIGAMFGAGWAEGIQKSAKQINRAVANAATGSVLTGSVLGRGMVQNDFSQRITIQNMNGANPATIDYLAYQLAHRQKAALAGVGTIGT